MLRKEPPQIEVQNIHVSGKQNNPVFVLKIRWSCDLTAATVEKIRNHQLNTERTRQQQQQQQSSVISHHHIHFINRVYKAFD